MIDKNILINEFNFENDIIYLNCGSLGKMPKSSANLLNQYLLDEIRCPTNSSNTERLRDTYYELKNKMSNILGVNDGNLAYIQSTNIGIGTLLTAFTWNKGDKILIGNNEYSDGVLPFYALKLKFGVEIIELDSQNLIEEINKNIDDKVKLIFFSHIEYNTGVIHDLKKIREAINIGKDTKLLVDGAQAIGQVNVQLDSVDFYVFPFHKWMLGPMGTGMIYIKSTKDLKPIILSTLGIDYTSENKRALRKDARLVENSSFNFWLFATILNNIRLLNKIGFENIYEHIETLASYFISELQSKNLMFIDNCYYKHGMAFIELNRTQNNNKLIEELENNNIYARTIPDSNKLRFCFHIYNTKKQIDVLVNNLINFRRNNK
ncbi:aminotransferase class V-fold PLP-dependent enzyme [Vallitalea sediminicola]